jgi:hypothetical protein
MNSVQAAAAAVVVMLAMGSTAALGQSKAECEGGKVKTPVRVEGQVTQLDAAKGTVTVRGDDGTTHVFQAGQETLQDFKVGGRIKATLREAPKCP